MSSLLQDDGSGRQQFTFNPVSGGFTISVLNGRVGCADLVAAQSCASQNTALTFAGSNDGSGLAVWRLAPPSLPPFVPYFTNGNYTIGNVLRAGSCAATSILGAVPCAAGNAVVMSGAGMSADLSPSLMSLHLSNTGSLLHSCTYCRFQMSFCCSLKLPERMECMHSCTLAETTIDLDSA